MTESRFPDKEGAYKIIQSQKQGKPGVKLWTCVPRATSHITFASALMWAEQLGQAANIGYDVVLRQPRMYELFASTPVYWLSALHKKLMGTNVLEAKAATNQAGVEVFAHCSRNQNSFIRRGALTLMTVNRNSDEVTFKVKFGVPQADKTMEVQYYILTAPSLNSSDMFLNDNLLTPEILTDKDPFKPKLRRAKTPSYIALTVPANSIAFFVLPGAKIPVCVEDEMETNMLLEEIEEDQKALLSEEIALKLEPRGSFGGNLVLEEITKQIKQEMESDERYYHDKLAGRFVETTDESKDEAKEDEEVVNRRRKYFIDRAKLSERRRKTPSFEKKKDDFKKFLLEKSKTAKLEAKSAPKSTQMELTSEEVEKILRSRAKARASQRNIVFTDAELNALVHKAKKKFYSDKVRRKRDTHELLLNQVNHPNHIEGYENTENVISNKVKRNQEKINKLITSRLRRPANDISYYKDADETKSNKIKLAVRSKRDINQLMFHRVTNADNLIQNKEKREEITQTKKKIPKNKRDIEKKRLGIETRIAERKHKMRAKKQVLKGRMKEKKEKSRTKRDVSMYVKMSDKLKLDNQALRDKWGQKLNTGKRSKRGTERLAEAKEKLRTKKQALKDRVKETLNNIRRPKRSIGPNDSKSSKRDIKKLDERKEVLREKKQAMKNRLKEMLNSVRRSRRDINMDMVNEHGKKKKQKIVKEATMRRPDQTSAEILAELEAEERAREMEDKPSEMKTEIFAQLADDEDDIFDVTPKRKDSGIFRKRKKDPLAIDIVEPHSKHYKSRKHQSKDEEVQFLTASEEFTDVEEDYPCIHEFFTGKQEPAKVQKITNMELGEYTAHKIKAGTKIKPGLWEESAGFRKRRSISEEDLKVEGLDIPQDSQEDRHEEQPKSPEQPESSERHLAKRDVNGSSEDSSFKSMYGMPKSEITRHLANLNRIMSLNKINPDVLKKRIGNTEENERHGFSSIAVEEKSRRGMLRQLDILRKKIQRRKNDIDKLLMKEAKKYGEIFPEQAGLFGNNLLSQFSRDLGKELSITKDLIRTQIPLEKKMKEYSYKLKEIADRNAKIGALLTSRSLSKHISSSEESVEAKGKSTFGNDAQSKPIKITESKEQHSSEVNEEKPAVPTAISNTKVPQQNDSKKVSLLLTKTGAVLQGDSVKSEQGHTETKNPTFSSRIGDVTHENVLVREQNSLEIQKEKDNEHTTLTEQITGNEQKSHPQLELDSPLLKTRMESNEAQEEQSATSPNEQENSRTSVEQQKQGVSIPTSHSQKSNPVLELNHPMLMARMGEAFREADDKPKAAKAMPLEQLENVQEMSILTKQENGDNIFTKQGNQQLHPQDERTVLMARTEAIGQQNEAQVSSMAQPQNALKDLLAAPKVELSEGIEQQITLGRHASDRENHSEQLHSQSGFQKPTVLTGNQIQLETINPPVVSTTSETIDENKNLMVKHQSIGQPITSGIKEYEMPLEQQNELNQYNLEDQQATSMSTIEKQLNDQLEMLLMSHNQQLKPNEYQNHLTSSTGMVESLQQPQSDMENLEDISPDDHITSIVDNADEPNSATANAHSSKFSSIEAAIAGGAQQQHVIEKQKNEYAKLFGELMENDIVPTTLKPAILESNNIQHPSEYIVHNILSQMPLTTQNWVTTEPEDTIGKLPEAIQDLEVEVNKETSEHEPMDTEASTDKLQDLKRKKRNIIGDKRFGDYRPLSKNLKKWKPSDIQSLKKKASSFKTLRPPPNDYHIFKSALEHNKVRIIRRSINFDVNDVENNIDKTDFGSEVFDKRTRDIFKRNRKNTIRKIKFEDSVENNKRNEINKYEEFLKADDVKETRLAKEVEEVDHRIRMAEDNEIKGDDVSHIQKIVKDNANKEKVDSIPTGEKNKPKTKLFERFVASLSGFLTNIGKQVGMYVKQINI
nr:unnamed protein product [Callosobruchus analis]